MSTRRTESLMRIAVALLIMVALLYAQDMHEPVTGMWGCSGSLF